MREAAAYLDNADWVQCHRDVPDVSAHAELDLCAPKWYISTPDSGHKMLDCRAPCRTRQLSHDLPIMMAIVTPSESSWRANVSARRAKDVRDRPRARGRGLVMRTQATRMHQSVAPTTRTMTRRV